MLVELRSRLQPSGLFSGPHFPTLPTQHPKSMTSILELLGTALSIVTSKKAAVTKGEKKIQEEIRERYWKRRKNNCGGESC